MVDGQERLNPSAASPDTPIVVHGGRSTEGRGWSGTIRLVALALLLSFAIVVGVIQAHLVDKAGHHHERAEATLSALDHLRTIDGIEWRVAAGEALPDAVTVIEGQAIELTNLLSIDNSATATRALDDVNLYVDAVLSMLAAYEAGEVDTAEAIDETFVDPRFDAALESLGEIADDRTNAAAGIERVARLLIWTSAVVAAILLGAVLLTAAATIERRHERERRRETDRRLRLLVDGSADIIMVVSDDESVSALTASNGGLLKEFDAGQITSMDRLLPAAGLERWRETDRTLRETGCRQTIELTVTLASGAVAWFDAEGSVLDEELGENVWIWRDISSRKALELQLMHQAFHDPLTGLANRSRLRDRVDHAISVAARSNRPVTLLFCDLDDFKSVNDALGHGVGDRMLQTIATRIAGCVREPDTVARLGGDEFAVLLEGSGAAHGQTLAERIIDVIGYEVLLEGRLLHPSVSIGIASAAPGTTSEELLRNADIAMYQAKRAGGGCSVVFRDQMHRVTTEHLMLRNDLYSALEKGQLTVEYQPTVALGDGSVIGVEALLRWRHPDLGNISPATFVPIAEGSGAILPVGRWVIDQACAAAVRLQQGRATTFLVSVNLSPRQLHDPSLVNTVALALARHGVTPDQLVFEVTEGCLLDDPLAVERLHELRGLGVQVAVDDFGTGYTSINYLQRLPVQILKIDRSFVSGSALPGQDRIALLNAIVSLSKSLRVRTVAEGIEDGAQLEELRALGCDAGQGFLWSRAHPINEVFDVITRIEAQASPRSERVSVDEPFEALVPGP